MNNLRNMKDELLAIALGGGTKIEIQNKIDDVMKKYVVEIGSRRSISKELIRYSERNLDEIHGFENERMADQIGIEMLKGGAINIELTDGDNKFYEFYRASAWVLK